MSVVSSETLPVVSEADIVVVRRRVREASIQVGLSLVDQTKLVTAASELARNTVIYGGGGALQLESLNGPRLGVRLIFSDQGRGSRILILRCAMGLQRAAAWVWGWVARNGWSMSLRSIRPPVAAPR